MNVAAVVELADETPAIEPPARVWKKIATYYLLTLAYS
jgi:hypothetical protein